MSGEWRLVESSFESPDIYLVASGKDALMDSIISASVLVAAVIYLIWGVSLEAYLGVIISVFIIKAGFDTMRDTISQILGERIDSELSKEIKETLCSYPEVNGAVDLLLHAYGPETLVGSVHIEVPHNISAPALDVLERRITADIYQKYGVALTGISIYAVDLDDPGVRLRLLMLYRVSELAEAGV